MIKKIAFTLAEVLIVIGIIGMVAEMTIPTLMNNVNTTVYPTQLKKMYSEMSQAIKMYMVDEEMTSLTDGDALYNGGSGAHPDAFIKKYFKVIKDCGYTRPCSALATPVKGINGGSATYMAPASFYCSVLASGSTLCMQPGGGGPAAVSIDVNGPKQPNKGGRDIFTFYIFSDGSIDEWGADPTARQNGAAEDNRWNRFYSKCLTSPYGTGCFGYLMNHGWKMDY